MIVAVRRLANTVNDAMDLRGKAGYWIGHCKAAGGDAIRIHSQEKTLQSATNDTAINQWFFM